MTAPAEGRTTLAHAIELLDRAAAAVTSTRHAVDYNQVKTRAQREALSRELAGAVGAVESVRLWLDAGAPR